MVKISRTIVWWILLIFVCQGSYSVCALLSNRGGRVSEIRLGSGVRAGAVPERVRTETSRVRSSVHRSYLLPSSKSSKRPISSTEDVFVAAAAPSPCVSGAGVQVTWTWLNETAGTILWRFSNPTNISRAVVLNRGASGSAGTINSYTFGEAFAFAYLANGLAFLDDGPYPALGSKPTSLPMGIVGKNSPIFCFIFTVEAGGSTSIEEGGFQNLQPFCDNLPDVVFEENAQVNINYNQKIQCEDFYSQEGAQDTMCVSDPFLHSWPVYQVANGTMSGQDYIIVDAGTTISFVNDSGGSSGSSSFACFPGDATLSVPSGNRVSIRDLNVGDQVETLAFSAKDGAPYLTQTRFLGFLDRRANQETMFLRLELEGNQEALEITPDHLLAVVPGGDLPNQPLDFVRARVLEPGSYLVLQSGKTAQVRSITSVFRTGAYGPLTESGTALVNGVLVSCYAHTESHDRAHRAMLPLRLAHRLYRWLPLDALALTDMGTSRDGFHPYARFLYQFRECLSVVRFWLSTLSSLLGQHVRGGALDRSV